MQQRPTIRRVICDPTVETQVSPTSVEAEFYGQNIPPMETVIKYQLVTVETKWESVLLNLKTGYKVLASEE